MQTRDLKLSFGRRVQAFRETKGLTQEQLADRIGRSVDTVSNIERGINGTRIEVAYQIATEVDVSLADLFTFDTRTGHTPKGEARATRKLLDLIADCDEATIRALTDLVGVALRLKTTVAKSDDGKAMPLA